MHVHVGAYANHPQVHRFPLSMTPMCTLRRVHRHQPVEACQAVVPVPRYPRRILISFGGVLGKAGKGKGVPCGNDVCRQCVTSDE